MTNLIDWIISNKDWLFSGIVGGLLALFVNWWFNKKLPKAYNIALVGFPKSGKTTLITRMFGEFFARNIQGINIVPKGTKTIERINDNLEKLEIGKKLGPTADQDLFAYRANVNLSGILPFFSRTYKIEFGDFQGEQSEKFTGKDEEWLHKTEFFKWVMESDAVIFIVDLACYLSNPDESRIYVSKISKAFRAAWQHILEYHENKGDAKKIPIVLAFTKADIFAVTTVAQDLDRISAQVLNLGFEDSPVIAEINKEDLLQGMDNVRSDFQNLISYFKSENKQLNIIFLSCFGVINNQMLGIKELMKAILPYGRKVK
ncbi:GTPase domain-containing protein [Candidatus Magnetomoraceae bacterium gMMP-15]